MAHQYWTPRVWIILGGLAFGVLASLLTKWGNPANMGICVACFYRDITGGLGLHRASVVQYLRPEIMGFVLGAFISASAFKEFRPRGGSSPIIRFLLGAFFMIGALVFLGCPIRTLIRLAGGDLNGIPALAGVVVGAFIGIQFLKKGYNLGRTRIVSRASAWMMPLFMVALLILIIFKPHFLFFSEKGPGSMYAPLILSLLVGLFVGFVAQKTRMCFVGGWRDIMLVRDFYLFSGIAAFFFGAIICNYVLGNFASGLYHWGFENQPVAHTSHLWNFLGMALAGLSATLLGGCPLRQTILSSEGDTDAGITVFGFIMGAGFSHNFLLASSPKGPGAFGPAAVIIGLVFCLVIGFLMMER
ncbi:MAG: YedE-related selenium metabolism membrane protein [Deltaproteobacteria bacterium]|nr:YedE-related selenium metabolism membrane protein [Deltaproteobacteria bacterium]